MLKINVLVLGGAGAREHTLCVMARRSSIVDKVYTFCDNAGTRRMDGVVVATMPDNHDRLINYCALHDIELVIVGPEAPLDQGVADALREGGILVFGPGHAGAQIEASKFFGRQLCEKYGIPHPKFACFKNLEAALQGLREWKTWPVVVKYDGLMGGKGVTIHDDRDEAAMRLGELFADGKGVSVLFEEFLPDNPAMPRSEISVHVIVSGDGSYRILPTVQDYKPRFIGDHGPMTGGMGCFGPVPGIDLDRIEREIVKPTIVGLLHEGIDYRGVIYFGLKMCPDGPKVVEFNCRFGDPETVIINQLLVSDLIPVMLAAAKGEDISSMSLEVFDCAAVGVVVVGKNYPTSRTQAQVFPHHLDNDFTTHAATRLHGEDEDDMEVVADGGRIAVVSARRATIADARKVVYGVISQGHLGGLAVRRDIAIGY